MQHASATHIILFHIDGTQCKGELNQCPSSEICKQKLHLMPPRGRCEIILNVFHKSKVCAMSLNIPPHFRQEDALQIHVKFFTWGKILVATRVSHHKKVASTAAATPALTNGCASCWMQMPWLLKPYPPEAHPRGRELWHSNALRTNRGSVV